ncbi:unnamed protein product [Citrullus colocynthis]|uniref:Uncharacterized protein n=1 Tax=Citrullus colocynthis TaxID=252529 RepID=A0ABP0XT76_9ROSI
MSEEFVIQVNDQSMWGRVEVEFCPHKIFRFLSFLLRAGIRSMPQTFQQNLSTFYLPTAFPFPKSVPKRHKRRTWGFDISKLEGNERVCFNQLCYLFELRSNWNGGSEQQDIFIVGGD